LLVWSSEMSLTLRIWKESVDLGSFYECVKELSLSQVALDLSWPIHRQYVTCMVPLQTHTAMYSHVYSVWHDR